MKKYTFVAVMLTVILAVSAAFTGWYVHNQEKRTAEGNLVIVTSFYPMYIAAMNIVGDTEGVTLENLSEPQTGCLHDFQLTPEDMKLLSGADVFIINGGGIESFMTEVASAYPDLVIVSACQDLELILEEDETQQKVTEDSEETDVNAHAWMSVSDYRVMVQTIAGALGGADLSNADIYQANAQTYDQKLAELADRQETIRRTLAGENVILFHEAFAYVAADYEMNVSMVMDLDEERQISAGEVAQVIAAVDEGADLILAEELYGADMARTVQRERDVPVLYLDPLTRGDYDADSYLNAMGDNLSLLEQYAGLQ